MSYSKKLIEQFDWSYLGLEPSDVKDIADAGRDVFNTVDSDGDITSFVTGAAAQTIGPELDAAGDRFLAKVPATAATATQSGLNTLGKPKNLAALGAAALAGGALAGTGAALANRVFGKKDKRKKKRQLNASSNPYMDRVSPEFVGGSIGATAGSLSGLIGGTALAQLGMAALKSTNPALGTALDIAGKAVGSTLGATAGGGLGYAIGKRFRKDRV